MAPRDEWERQYRLARDGAALVARPDRGLIEVTGADRAAWLNNLVTNVVKTLKAGEGSYAFAVNVKGRVIFDLNILMLDDPARPDGRIWLDIDTGWIADAYKHLDRYIITENAKLADLTSRTARLAVLGPRAPDVVRRLGLGNLAAMPALQHLGIDGREFVGTGNSEAAMRMVRHDFAGVIAAEFIVSAAVAAAWQAKLLEAGPEEGIELIGPDAVEVLRIEAGLPASRRDIDADVIPPETGQIERGINYHKGCYLGQEVIERMRSHGVIPKKFVGIRLSCGDVPAGPLTLQRGGSEIGRSTSLCWSVALAAPLALGYIKSAHAAPAAAITAIDPTGASLEAEIVALPVQPPSPS